MRATGAGPHAADSSTQLASSVNTVNMVQQMHYSANIPIASQNGTGLLNQGGGIVPPALLEESRVPRFYQEAIASCGAVSASQLPNTALVYNLMVTSRLPRPVLGNIWSLVNRTLPGQLTRQEFFSCLALIALAQRGQSLSALSNVTVLPIPHFQACTAFPSQQFIQGQPVDHHVAVVCPSTAPPTSTRTMPVQMGVAFPQKKSASMNSLAATSRQVPHSLNPVICSSGSQGAQPVPSVNQTDSQHCMTSGAVSMSQPSKPNLANPEPAVSLLSTAPSSKSQIHHSLTSPAVSQASLFQSMPVSLVSGVQMPSSMTMPAMSNAYSHNLTVASAGHEPQDVIQHTNDAKGRLVLNGCSSQPSVSSSTASTQRLPPFTPTALLTQSTSKISTTSRERSLPAFVNFANFENAAATAAMSQPLKHSSSLLSSDRVVSNGHLGNTQMHQSAGTNIPTSLTDNALNTSLCLQQSTVKSNSSFSLFDSLNTHLPTPTVTTTHKTDLDLLCDISFEQPTSAAVPPRKAVDSEVTTKSMANSATEQFGDFASSKPTRTMSSGTQLLIPQPVVPISFGNETLMKEREEVTDIYAAVKAVEGNSNDDQGERECLRVWERCIAEAYHLLKDADILLPPFSEEVVKAVAHTERGMRYLSALKAVYEMVSRIRKGRNEDLIKVSNEIGEIDKIWARLNKYVDPSADEHPQAMRWDGIVSKRCGICVSDINEDALLEFAGTAYHKQCANLWINRIDSLLPKLS